MSPELKKRRTDNKILCREILNYAKPVLRAGLSSYKSIEEVLVDLELRKRVENKEEKMRKEKKIKKDPNFKLWGIHKKIKNPIYLKLEEMIRQYQQEEVEINELEEEEKMKTVTLPEVPMLELLTQRNPPSLRKWLYGRYMITDSLEKFVEEYCYFANRLVEATEAVEKAASEGETVSRKIKDLADLAEITPILPLKTPLIRHYIINDKTDEPFEKGYINNVLSQHRFSWG